MCWVARFKPRTALKVRIAAQLAVFCFLALVELLVFTGWYSFHTRPPHNWEFRRAVTEYIRDPKPYTRAIVEAERINYWNNPVIRRIQTVNLLVLLGNTLLLLFVWRRYLGLRKALRSALGNQGTADPSPAEAGSR